MRDLISKYSGHMDHSHKPGWLIIDGSSASVQEQVYKELRDDILSSVFEPGQALVIDELADRFSVNANHIREALLRLEAAELVDYNPYRGYRVSLFTPDDLKEIYFLRSLLEGTASYLAARNLSSDQLARLGTLCEKMEQCLDNGDVIDMPSYNAEFHETIYMAAKSPRLYKMITVLWNSFPQSSVAFLTYRAPVMVKEHRAMYEALLKRDSEKAQLETQNHMDSVLTDLVEYWSHRMTPLEENG